MKNLERLTRSLTETEFALKVLDFNKCSDCYEKLNAGWVLMWILKMKLRCWASRCKQETRASSNPNTLPKSTATILKFVSLLFLLFKWEMFLFKQYLSVSKGLNRFQLMNFYFIIFLLVFCYELVVTHCLPLGKKSVASLNVERAIV